MQNLSTCKMRCKNIKNLAQRTAVFFFLQINAWINLKIANWTHTQIQFFFWKVDIIYSIYIYSNKVYFSALFTILQINFRLFEHFVWWNWNCFFKVWTVDLKRTKDIKQWLKLYSLELTKLGSRYGTLLVFPKIFC